MLMSASADDFVWYNDVDDEHPITQLSPGTDSNASQLLLTSLPSSAGVSVSPGPESVRQLRGERKLTIEASKKPLPPIKKAGPSRHSVSKKHARTEEEPKTLKRSKAGGKLKAPAPEDEPKCESGSGGSFVSSSDDDIEVLNELSHQDKSGSTIL
jgi:hypothetical protein